MSIHLKHLFMINNIIYFILWIFLFGNVYSLEVIIRNTEKDISSIPTILHNIPLYKDGLTLYFPDPYYDFSPYDIWIILTTMEHSVSFISTSKNNTIFDHGNNGRIGFSFNFNDKEAIQTVYFKGIIFTHFYAENSNLITVNVINDLFHIVFEDCQFIDIISSVITTFLSDVTCGLVSDDFRQVEFNNCKFV